MSRAASSAIPNNRATWALILCVISLFAAVAGIFARELWAEFCYRLFLEGAWTAGWLFAALGLGTLLLKLAGVRDSSKALIFATAAGLGLGVMSAAILFLGLTGILNHASGIGILVAGWAAGAWPAIRSFRFRIPVVRAVHWLWLLIVPAAAMTVVGAFTLPGLLWTDEPAGFDVLEYHLQIPREWFEAGRIIPLSHNVFSYFPFNVEMHYLLAMHLHGGPWAGMYLAQMMHGVFVALGIVAIYGAARGRAKPQAAVVIAIAAASVPWLSMLAPIAYDEGGLLLFGALAIAWVVRSIDSPDRMKLAALAGVMAGFACGTKFTAVPMLLLAISIAGLVARCMTFKACAAFVIPGVITFSPWLVRNLVWTGNPVFPEAMSFLGHGHFTPEQIERWSNAYLPDQPRFIAAWKQLIADWRFGFAFLPMGFIALILSWRRREARFFAMVVALQLVVWIGFTHIQGRFLVMSVPLVAMLIGMVELRRWLAMVVCMAIGSAGIGWIVLGRRMTALPPALGFEDYRPIQRASLLPADVASKIFDDQRPIVLVGESQAFLYQIPMSRLHYRTVFDVTESWIEGDLPANGLIVISPIEVQRLWKFYPPLPPMPVEIMGRERPFILRN